MHNVPTLEAEGLTTLPGEIGPDCKPDVRLPSIRSTCPKLGSGTDHAQWLPDSTRHVQLRSNDGRLRRRVRGPEYVLTEIKDKFVGGRYRSIIRQPWEESSC